MEVSGFIWERYKEVSCPIPLEVGWCGGVRLYGTRRYSLVPGLHNTSRELCPSRTVCDQLSRFRHRFL